VKRIKAFHKIEEVDFTREKTLALVGQISERYLKKYMGSPLEVFARVHSQYQGMCHCRSAVQKWMRRLASMVLIVKFFLNNLYLGIRGRRSEDPKELDGIKTGGALPEYEVPPVLEGLRIESWDPKISYLAWTEVLHVVWGLLRVGCLEFEVYYKSLTALAQQAGLFEIYRPRFVLMYKEYDFVGSLLTWQCRRRGSSAYNVMHGDKAYFVRDSFFVFDRYYVWHDGYGVIAKELLADPGEVVVFEPYRFRKLEIPQGSKFDLLVVMPTMELDAAQCNAWAGLLKRLAVRWEVRIRPHPRYPPNPALMDLIKEGQLKVSDPRLETAVEAMHHARSVLGYQSTMLIEAAQQGIMVFCLWDGKLEQMLTYHPFLRDDAIKKVRFESVELEIEACLS